MKIYFYTPSFFSGGVKMLYRHAELLSLNNIPAYIVHTNRNYCTTKFIHNAKILYWDDITLTDSDIVVIPEFLSVWINPEKNPEGIVSLIKKKISKNRYRYNVKTIFDGPSNIVIYNQNAYLTFFDYPIKVNDFLFPYTNPKCISTICVSQDNYDYLKLAFPNIPLQRINYAIDSDVFKPDKKKRQIAYLTFKNHQAVQQVINLLKIREKLNDFALVPVEGTEMEVAKIFNESMIMLNFGNIEGFGLPPAEAMLSGCVVIGYHGEAGKEFMNESTCFPIANGDIQQFILTTESVVDHLSRDPNHYSEMTNRARLLIMTQYSKNQEHASVLNAWSNIIKVARLK